MDSAASDGPPRLRRPSNAVYAWAAANDLVQSNPVLAINRALPKAGGQVEHRRALPWQEVPQLLATVEASGAAETTKHCVRFLALTAARSGEVRAAEWTEIDLDAKVWTIPASKMKQAKEHRVPLSAAALAVIEAAQQYRGDSTLVFPSKTGRALSDGALSKLFGELGIACVPHGLRATFRTWAAEAGVSREIAEFCLAHVVGSQAERAYQRSDLFRDRVEVMERWAATLTS